MNQMNVTADAEIVKTQWHRPRARFPGDTPPKTQYVSASMAKTKGAKHHGAKISAELSFAQTFARDVRVGGSICGGGQIDETLYRWHDSDGEAYWKIVNPREMDAQALHWLAAVEPASASARKAEACTKTLTTHLLDEKERWMPQARKDVIPVRGKYLILNEDGRIKAQEPHPDFGMTYCIAAQCDESKIDAQGNYQPGGVVPGSRWAQYLETTFGDDIELRDFAQEVLSTVLLHRCFEQSIWLYGDGENGKSVLLHVLSKIVGTGRAVPMNLDRLVRDQFGVATLQGARLVTVSEVPDRLTRAMQDKLKELISWDAQPLERKHKDAFTFLPSAVWVLASNKLPKASQHEHGFWRKVLTLPFTRRVPAQLKIQDFHKLITEDPGEMAQVMDWLLAGAQRLMLRGNKFPPLPQSVAQLAQTQRLCTDHVAAFIDECMLEVDDSAMTGKIAIYSAYRDFCADNGVKAQGSNGFWNDVRASLGSCDTSGKRGPARKDKYGVSRRDRYVPLRAQDIDPLPQHEWPAAWLPDPIPADPAVEAPVAWTDDPF